VSAVDIFFRKFEGQNPEFLRSALSRAMVRIKEVVVAAAKDNAPISPTKEQYETTLKRKTGEQVMLQVDPSVYIGGRPGMVRKIVKVGGTKRTDFTPGQLTASITGESNDTSARIFVPANSTAGKYANYIHNRKGEDWFNRGVGTEAKGDQADEKFILRAIEDNKPTLRAIIEQEVGRALLAPGGRI
jgi:hypothetical protein